MGQSRSVIAIEPETVTGLRIACEAPVAVDTRPGFVWRAVQWCTVRRYASIAAFSPGRPRCRDSK
jgi:hypothetical protein